MKKNISSHRLGIIIALFLLGAAHAVAGQELNTKLASPATAPVITASATGERVRITAPSSVVQMHLEVYAAGGEKLFDQEIRGGNVFDWHLQDGQGQRLAPGAYVCVVTAKSVSGKLTQKIGTVTIAETSASVQPTAALSAPQAQTIGPVEENSSWTIPGNDEPQTTTVIAHDGADGQMIRGRGALSFRIGNFFSGIDQEQMRLTETGNLGIGTSQPQAKLDVAGAIRAERFLVVKPNKSGNDRASSDTATIDSSDSVQPLTGGTGTTGQLTKWTDGTNGTLGDSGITELGNNIGIGTTTPSQKLQVVGGPLGIFTSPSTGGLTIDGSVLPGATSVFSDYLGGTEPKLHLASYSGRASAAGITINTSGNVGIGTTDPTNLLHLNNTNGAAAGLRLDTVTATTANGGALVLNAPSGSNHLVFEVGGAQKWVQYVAGNDLRLYSGADKVTFQSTGNIGVGTTSPSSKLDVAGDINTLTQYNIGGNGVLSVTGGIGGFRNSNTFAGVGAGAVTFPALTDDGGNDNSFFGSQAGVTNTSGFANSFFGFSAGRASTFGDSNSFFGSSAGLSNTSGRLNTFVGSGSGLKNQTGKENSFFGYEAGQNSTGDSNTFIGFRTGINLNSGSNNTMLGMAADVGADNLNNATAIGANSQVTQSNSLVLGSINGTNGATSDTNVGIGTSAPVNVLHLNGNHNDFALTFTNQSNTSGRRGYRIAFDSDRLTFQSANDSGAFAANQMTIDPPTGNVGIGTTAPSFKLHINDPSNTGLRVQNNTSGGTVAGFGGFGAFQIDTIATTGGRFTVKENGNTGIGTNNPNAKLQVVGGNVYIANPNGVIISSPNGVCWQIGISNAGALTTIAVPCP